MQAAEDIVSSALFVLEALAGVHQDEQQNDERESNNILWLPVTTVFSLMKCYHNNGTILLRVIHAFNTIYLMVSEKVKAKMVEGYSEWKISDFVYEKIVKLGRISRKELSTTSRKELQDMHTNILNGFYGPLLKVGPGDQQILSKRLERMSKDVFNIKDNESEDNSKANYDLLGCSNPSEPWKEFGNSPFGKLALYLLFYFRNKHKKHFKKFIKDYACKAEQPVGCPLMASSIQMVELLCEILQIKSGIIPIEKIRLKNKKNQRSNSIDL